MSNWKRKHQLTAAEELRPELSSPSEPLMNPIIPWNNWNGRLYTWNQGSHISRNDKICYILTTSKKQKKNIQTTCPKELTLLQWRPKNFLTGNLEETKLNKYKNYKGLQYFGKESFWSSYMLVPLKVWTQTRNSQKIKIKIWKTWSRKEFSMF